MLLAQLTDLHVRPEGIAAYRVAETNMLTERALRRVGSMRPAIDAVIITGDLTDCGLRPEYELLAGLMARYLPMPAFAVPGNHDRREAMLECLPETRRADGFVQYAVDDFPVRMVMLDTVAPGAGWGELCARRLEWLDAALAAAPDKPTIIGMHHPPFLCGLASADRIALRAPERFAAIVAKHRQVERILCGHHHRPVVARVAHAIATIAPSVAHQSLFDLAENGWDGFVLEPGAFEVHRWTAESGIVSHTVCVEEFPGPFPFLADPDYPGRGGA